MRTRAADDSIERMVGPGTPTPIPAGPSHCVCGCGRELEPLRRRGGYARECMRVVKISGSMTARVMGVSAPAALPKRSARYRLIRQLPKRGDRRRVLIECDCGEQTEINANVWRNRPPKCCNKCRLRRIDAHGFEAEHG
jgi:hypothetical protein